MLALALMMPDLSCNLLPGYSVAGFLHLLQLGILIRGLVAASSVVILPWLSISIALGGRGVVVGTDINQDG